jgi:methionine sulfoxide reductase catalytic subunit
MAWHIYLSLADLGFPIWLRAAHWINLFFMGFLIRSGIQILGSYPRLYWNDHSKPGAKWANFTRKEIPKDRLWITLEQEVNVPPWLGQPGGKLLGLGRHWHFFSIIFWVLNGLIYVILLFATGEWKRLIPTSWSIFPNAFNTFITYITFHIPPASNFHPYDPLQQLTYAAVVFLLGPFLIITGAAQSPAIQARFTWLPKLLGGRQSARSLHFLGLIAFVIFIIIHVSLVVIVNFGRDMGDIVLGQDQHDQGLAVVLGMSFIAATLIIYGITTRISLLHPRLIQHALGAVVHPLIHVLSINTISRQRFTYEDISPEFLVNGALPEDEYYKQLSQQDFVLYRLEVMGLVQQPLSLSLSDLYGMPQEEQITRHNCIQGWTGIAAWKGVPMTEILARCQPLPEARYAIFWSYSNDTSNRPFYESLDISILKHPQTILAYEMNDWRLPVPHGAPLRLRSETQLGFKIVKWIRRIEFVTDYHTIRGGQGGSREDNKFYETSASI